MDFSQLVRTRQSDRVYTDRAVDRQMLTTCLESARLSPSACNSQPWKFVVVDDPELKNRVAGCAASMGMNKFAATAPVIVAVVLEKGNLLSGVGSVLRGKEYSLMDIGVAVGQFCLQAADLGLGTCIIGWFDEGKVRRLLGVKGRKRIPLLVSVGYPGGATREKVRRPLEEMSAWNGY